MIDLSQFHAILDSSGARGYPLNQQQRDAADHGQGPLWIMAGPGSGKSEVLVTRTLKLICVDGVEPSSVFITTFTIKAARNLEDRLASYLISLQQAEPKLAPVDLSGLRIGTLHSLCNDILQEFRFPDYQNVRLLDDVEQHLFVYRHADIADELDVQFWHTIGYVFSRWTPTAGYPPNKWDRVKAAVILFNHIVEDVVDLGAMQAAGGEWVKLADYYEQYAQELTNRYRCDFAHLQKRFLDFLSAPIGQGFLQGLPDKNPGLNHVLVDEYQDTNPIQERTYLALAINPPHNIAVVGDDDQALYRFRGGTVACMVNFDKACQSTIGVAPQLVQLVDNYRSHDDVVDFFNDYIGSFSEMTAPGVRAPGKQPVVANANRPTQYPGIAWITTKKARDLGDAVGDFVRDDLMGAGVITDWSQCVLLLRSAKDSPRNAAPYLRAFEARNIPVYNPRSKAFMDSDEVQCILASLVHVLDPHCIYAGTTNPNGNDPTWKTAINGWVAKLLQIHDDPATNTQSLQNYIIQSNTELIQLCGKNKGRFLNLNIQEILFRILSIEPFKTWRRNPEKNLRLSKVTRLFESYHSFNLDTLRVNANGDGLDESFLGRLYWMFFDYLVATGINDDEDEEVIVPPGYLPVMTIHQAKGLEFPFVIVGQLGTSGRPGAAQGLEQDLAPFRQDLYSRGGRAPDLLALEDDIRLLYVAYSRAEYALILAGTQAQMKNHVATPGRDFTAFRRHVRVI